MPFEPVQETKGRFVPLDEEKVYRSETNSMVTAPSGLKGPEIGYFDDTTNLKQNPQEYFGYSKVLKRTKDIAAIPGKAVVASAINIGTTMEAGSRQRIADALKQGTMYDVEEIHKKAASGQKLNDEERRIAMRDIGNRNNILGFLFKSPEDFAFDKGQAARNDPEKVLKLTQKADKLALSVADMRKRSDEIIERNFARPKEGESTAVERVAYDIFGVGTSIAASIGLAILTKNPVSSAAFFGELQKNSVYLEGTDAGIEPQKNRDTSTLAGLVEGGIEFVGVHYFFKLAENSKPLWGTIYKMGEEALQEMAQSAGESAITQSQGYREVDLKGAAVDALYSGFLGAFGAGGGIAVESIYKRMKKENTEKDWGLTDDQMQVLSEKLHDNFEGMNDILAEEIQGQVSPLKDDETNDLKVARIIQDFSEGKPIDPTILSEEDQRILAESSQVDQKLQVIDAQEGRGFIPVPKRPQTLAEFIKSKGGIKLDTGEARRFTRKETPALKGVANKNGKLSLDEARELAVEAGFLGDTDYEGGVAVSTEQDLLDALESEADGMPVVLDQTAMNERDQILEYNEQLAQAHNEILTTSKQVKSFRAAFKEGVRSARKDVKKAQATLVKALNEAKLRPEDKAKFIAAIKNIQTVQQLQKAAPDIQERVQNLLEADVKRKLRKQIKKRIATGKTSKKVSADTIENIKRLERALYETGVLGKGMRDTPVTAFKAAFDEANTLLSEGKIKLLIYQEQKKERQAQRLEELAGGTVPLSNAETARAPLGERLGIFDKFKNTLIEGYNRAQRLNLNKNPMDVLFDIMDGNQNYKGPNSEIFKRTIDRGHSRFLQLKESLTRDIKNLADSLNLDDRNFNRIGVYAALQQEGGADKIKATGITEEEIENLVLEPEELEFYDAMRERLDSMVPALKEVMLRVYNKEFKSVENYFPFMTDFEAMSGAEIQNMFGDQAALLTDTAADFNKKDVEKGFAKERKGGKNAIKIDAMRVFLSHVENASYLIEMGQDIKELGELALTKDFENIAGDLGQEIVLDWIDILARKGRAANRIDFLETFRVNTGAAVLAFKLSSVMIQPTALLDGAAFVGSQYVSRGTFSVTQQKWREFLYQNMPEIRERVGDDPEYLNMGGQSIVAKSREVGFWALKKLDLMAASSVAAGAYIKSVEQRGGVVDLANPDPIAIEEAQLAMRRTQSSSFAKDAAPIISQGKLTGNASVDKLILQFQSFMLNRWSLIQHDMIEAGVAKGRTKQAMNIATFLILANMSEYFIRHWTKELIAAMTGAEPPEEKEPDEVIIKQAISNVPFVSSIVNSGEYGSVPVPSISLVEKVSESAYYAMKSKKPEKKAKHWTQAAIVAVGGTLGVPGTLQASQLAKGAFDGDKDKKKKVSSP